MRYNQYTLHNMAMYCIHAKSFMASLYVHTVRCRRAKLQLQQLYILRSYVLKLVYFMFTL